MQHLVKQYENLNVTFSKTLLELGILLVIYSEQQ
jgi:hypothetical protein